MDPVPSGHAKSLRLEEIQPVEIQVLLELAVVPYKLRALLFSEISQLLVVLEAKQSLTKHLLMRDPSLLLLVAVHTLLDVVIALLDILRDGEEALGNLHVRVIALVVEVVLSCHMESLCVLDKCVDVVGSILVILMTHNDLVCVGLGLQESHALFLGHVTLWVSQKPSLSSKVKLSLFPLHLKLISADLN